MSGTDAVGPNVISRLHRTTQPEIADIHYDLQLLRRTFRHWRSKHERVQSYRDRATRWVDTHHPKRLARWFQLWRTASIAANKCALTAKRLRFHQLKRCLLGWRNAVLIHRQGVMAFVARR